MCCLEALFVRKTVKLTVATVEEEQSVTKDAISSQAAHIIEEDGTVLRIVLTCRFRLILLQPYRLIFSPKSLSLQGL